MDARAPSHHPYCAFYCEENIWHLAQDPSLPAGPRHVLLITNAQRKTVLFHQRAGLEDQDGFVLWDYHVILLIETEAGPQVYDLDTRLRFPCALSEYVRKTFGSQAQLPPPLRAHVRVIPASFYVEAFSSDRAHMRDPEGGWLQPPPAWPPLEASGARRWTLAEALDLDCDAPGEWLEAAALSQRFSVPRQVLK